MKIFILVFVLLAMACGTGSDNLTSGREMTSLMEVADEATFSPLRQKAAQAQSPIAETEKKVIKTGSLNYRVESNEEEYQRVKELLEKYKAYISSENEYKGGDRINFSLGIRVPPQHFDALIQDISVVHKVENRSVNISDVTERYYDLESRIANKEKLEQRYLEILGDAKTVSDILEVERNLNQVRSEIESLQGQFKMLKHQVNYSRLEVSFYEILPYQVVDDQRPGFGKRILNALSAGWGILLSVVVGLVQLWPFALLVLVVLLIIRKMKSRK